MPRAYLKLGAVYNPIVEWALREKGGLRRLVAVLLLLLVPAPQVIAALVGGTVQVSPCGCGRSCCRPLRGEAPSARHCSERSGSTKLSCHHPEHASVLPSLGQAILPSPVAGRPEAAATPLGGPADTAGRAGFPRVFAPPPRLLLESA
jgi:hypothetical protein